MGRQQKTDPDLEQLADLEDGGLPGQHLVRRFLVTHERSGRGLPRRPREATGGRRRRPDRQPEDL